MPVSTPPLSGTRRSSESSLKGLSASEQPTNASGKHGCARWTEVGNSKLVDFRSRQSQSKESSAEAYSGCQNRGEVR